MLGNIYYDCCHILLEEVLQIWKQSRSHSNALNSKVCKKRQSPTDALEENWTVADTRTNFRWHVPVCNARLLGVCSSTTGRREVRILRPSSNRVAFPESHYQQQMADKSVKHDRKGSLHCEGLVEDIRLSNAGCV